MILLVDDVEINRELAKIILEKQGHQVVLAVDGQDALEKARNGGFDLILMDIQMPVMDGFEATNEIRAFELAHKRQPVPIVAMTAYALQGDKERCLAAGMDAYLSKPIKEDDLLAVIERMVSGQPPQQPAALVMQADVQSQDQAQQPIFDRQALLVRLGGNETLIQKFVTMFFDSADEHMNLLRQAVEAGDAEQMRAKAHAIKGSAGNVGACALSAAAAEFEKAVREGQTEEYARRMDLLKKQFESFRIESGGS
jgi:two-component system, sensor histidine kinase and response regulator